MRYKNSRRWPNGKLLLRNWMSTIALNTSQLSYILVCICELNNKDKIYYILLAYEKVSLKTRLIGCG